MSTEPISSLELLRPHLDAMQSADVREPNLRVAVYHQDTNDLKTLVAPADVSAQLLKVGIDPQLLSGLLTALDASRAAQSAWVVSTDRSKPLAQKEREQRGFAHRSEMVAACRWNLRGSRSVQAALDVINEGEGIPDLVQDLRDTAAVTEANLPAFDKDETFDAKTGIETARTLAGEIAAGQSDFAINQDSADAKDLRDRAWTWLRNIDVEVRAAARHAFRNDPEMLARFIRPSHTNRKPNKAQGGDGDPT